MFPWRREAPSSSAPSPPSFEQSLRLRRIFDDTHDLAWRTLRRFGVSADRVEDSFQQVFLIAAERLDDILPGRERAFIYGVVLRVARSHMRGTWREIPDDELDSRVAAEPGPEVLVDRRRLIEACDGILTRLHPDLREVFILHEIEGLSGSELSRLLELPEGTVHSRLRRARIRVRTEVEALGAQSAVTEVRRG